MKKRICILGSTGSIGRQTLEVCEKLGYEVVGLAVKSSVALLAEQALRWGTKKVCVYDAGRAEECKALLGNKDITVLSGMEGLCELASMEEADIVVNAVVGMIGLRPTLAAIGAKKPVALANKETLVAGGELVMAAARENGVPILPVDSEHSAIFQSLQGNTRGQVKKLILTASGGPFYGRRAEQLADITVEQALAHPNWSMGAKVTIDSATLMNKGLEMMEAGWLFDMPADQIEVVVHRESIVHSLVEYQDNALIGQLGSHDMRLPIQYALTYPERLPCPAEPLSLFDYPALHFAKPDEETFVCLRSCREAMRRGGLYPALVNGANEQAVELFLKRQIRFLEIGRLVEGVLSLDLADRAVTLEQIAAADQMGRDFVCSHCQTNPTA